MPATMNVHRLATFRDRLQPGLLFKLSGFDISQCNQNFRLSYSLMTIRFSDSTNRDVLTGTDSSIPEESFMIVPKLRFASWPTPTSVPDIDRFMFCLPFHSNISVTLSLLDSQAVSFHKKLEGFRGYPRVAVASSINPKMVRGLLFSTATSGSHVFFDKATGLFDFKMHTGFQRHWEHPCSFIAERLSKVEPLTIAELNEFVTISEPQVHKEANIERSYPCVTCSNTNTVGVLRYRVEMSLADDTAEGLLVRFDGEMTKLHNMRAYEAGHLIVSISCTGYRVEMSLADDTAEGLLVRFDGEMTKLHNMRAYEAGHLIGQQIQFYSSHQTFTNENDRMHVPDFIAHDGDDHDGDDMPGAISVVSKVDGGRNERAETSIAVASLSGRHQETFGVKVFKGGQEAT
ncbi:hypothetical protein F2Q70_00031802 [Brassica cretica]|uniref:Uncharacterized protein n=1 Tax=Brassica cretica TaxID=69181 RepID=A0A8S9FLW5_BRACR|nr:hypothetical protein F2Q70_00031802 [Brassica cretica]